MESSCAGGPRPCLHFSAKFRLSGLNPLSFKFELSLDTTTALLKPFVQQLLRRWLKLAGDTSASRENRVHDSNGQHRG